MSETAASRIHAVPAEGMQQVKERIMRIFKTLPAREQRRIYFKFEKRLRKEKNDE